MRFIKSNIIWSIIHTWIELFNYSLMCKTNFPDICAVSSVFSFIVSDYAKEWSVKSDTLIQCLSTCFPHLLPQPSIPAWHHQLATAGKLPILQSSFPFSDGGFPFLAHFLLPSQFFSVHALPASKLYTCQSYVYTFPPSECWHMKKKKKSKVQ